MTVSQGGAAHTRRAVEQSNAGSRISGRRYLRTNFILFLCVHLSAVFGMVIVGWSWKWLLLAVASYYARMIVVTAGYHRYFAHRSYRTSRAFQFLLAVGAQSAAQRGVLWWAGHHRWHHKHSDTPLDVHSAKQRGFWYAHVGWLLTGSWNETDTKLVPDLAKYPELRWLDRPFVHFVPVVALGLAFLLLGGLPGFVWGFLVSTVMVWHGSFSVNSFAHLVGKRRYATRDDSRNSWLLAILTTGEGWHNNHHHFPGAASQGFFWWEIDITYYVLVGLSRLGLVWDVRRVPEATRDGSWVQEAARSAA
jgi:stearoyl-CoA desaturase (Delta-9 desaturase)